MCPSWQICVVLPPPFCNWGTDGDPVNWSPGHSESGKAALTPSGNSWGRKCFLRLRCPKRTKNPQGLERQCSLSPALYSDCVPVSLPFMPVHFVLINSNLPGVFLLAARRTSHQSHTVWRSVRWTTAENRFVSLSEREMNQWLPSASRFPSLCWKPHNRDPEQVMQHSGFQVPRTCKAGGSKGEGIISIPHWLKYLQRWTWRRYLFKMSSWHIRAFPCFYWCCPW